MRKFQFRLQALHDTAYQRERSVRHDLVRAEGIETRIRAQLDAMTRTAADWESRIRDNQRNSMNVKALKEQLGALGLIQRQILKQHQSLKQAQKATEKVRAQLSSAARKRKSLERLRERMYDEYKEECAARQVKLADEMASVRAATHRANRTRDDAITGVSQ